MSQISAEIIENVAVLERVYAHDFALRLSSLLCNTNHASRVDQLPQKNVRNQAGIQCNGFVGYYSQGIECGKTW